MEVGHQFLDTAEFHNLSPIAGFHSRDGLGVGNPELKGKRLVCSSACQEYAHSLGKTQAHRIERLGRFRLQALIDADMNHGSCVLHRVTPAPTVYELRYRCNSR